MVLRDRDYEEKSTNWVNFVADFHSFRETVKVVETTSSAEFGATFYTRGSLLSRPNVLDTLPFSVAWRDCFRNIA